MSAFAGLFLLAFALLARRESERRRHWFWRTGGGRLATSVFAVLLFIALSITTGGFDILLAGLALLLLLPGPIRPRPGMESPAFLESGVATLIVGVMSAAVVAFVWGSLDPVARVHDEAAYVLQARLFASGRWTGAARPLPEFFEQMQVFVTPVLASKYPPGHSLVLVPGIWLGVPALMPLLLNAAAGSLIFAHARRLAGAWVALATWLLWVSAPGTLDYRASYLSQNTTTVLWLLALWSLREWLSTGSRRWLMFIACCLGLGAITRPMTMVALALPIGVVILLRVKKNSRWKDLSTASVAGSLFLALGVVWSIQTIGEWRTSPYREYSRVYFPYEWTGFGERQDTPLRARPPAMDSFDRQFRRLHAEHTVRALPAILVGRVQRVFYDQWAGGRQSLMVFAVVGALALCTKALFAVVSGTCLVLAHLFMAHFFSWTVYYLEVQPVLSFVTAVGLGGVIASILGSMSRRRLDLPRGIGLLVFSALIVILATDAFVRVVEARDARTRDAEGLLDFRERVLRLADPRVTVFVRYGQNHQPHRNLVVNDPDLASAKAWIVHDLGDRNSLLISRAPGRKAYLYDDASRSFSRIPSD